MLRLPSNPNGKKNLEVIFPYLIGDDITTRPKDRFIVDFRNLGEDDASLFEAPFAYIGPVKLHRIAMAQPEALEKWWQHWRVRNDMRRGLAKLDRFIVTSRVSKHRVFVWSRPPVLADNAV